MFVDLDDSVINYYQGTEFNVPERTSPLTTDFRVNSELNLARFMTVRNNCSTACSKKLLADLPEEEQNSYLQNAKIGQNNLKTINNNLSKELDSCIRGCFSKKILSLSFY
jgi:hypothetical protein